MSWVSMIRFRAGNFLIKAAYEVLINQFLIKQWVRVSYIPVSYKA